MIEGHVSGSLLGSTAAPDVEVYVKTLLEAGTLTTASPYKVAFLGVPTKDPSSSSGQDSLTAASSSNQLESAAGGKQRKTVTIVGGLLVAAFGLAIFGIIFILYRRRQQFLKSQDIDLALSKSDMQYKGGGTNSNSEDGPKTLGQTTSEEYLDSIDNAKSTEAFPNNITFDLGNSFKDQLMGVHGTQRNKLPPFGINQGNIDGASDSDADSWAQTDGTIGSLEHQLDPITAEV